MSAAENIAAMDDIDLMDCVIGIVDRAFEPGHPNELALREIATRFWRMAVKQALEANVANGTLIKRVDGYYVPSSETDQESGSVN